MDENEFEYMGVSYVAKKTQQNDVWRVMFALRYKSGWRLPQGALLIKR